MTRAPSAPRVGRRPWRAPAGFRSVGFDSMRVVGSLTFLELTRRGRVTTVVCGLAVFLSTAVAACSDDSPGSPASVNGADAGPPADGGAPNTDAEPVVDSSAPPEPGEPIALALGARHSCVVVRRGSDGGTRTFCWGASTEGQLGQPGTGFVRPPLPAGVELRALSSHATSDTTCGIGLDDAVVCWGKNDQAQCALAASPSSAPAVVLDNGVTVRSDFVAVGGAFGCIHQVSSLGMTLACWGRNTSCELGTSAAPCTDGPVAAPEVGDALRAISEPSSVSLGGAHACAVGPSSMPVVSCWGANDAGQSSGGTDPVISPPAAIERAGVPLEATAVAAGGRFSCALDTSKHVVCWGDNTDGAISDGPRTANTPPAEAFPAIEATAMAAGAGVLCIVDATRNVRCRGAGDKGQLGRGVVVSDGSAGNVVDLSDVAALAVGGRHACAIAKGSSGRKTVHCWGDNGEGQVDPSRSDRSPIFAPTEVPIPAPVP